jgi:hypothetical protein
MTADALPDPALAPALKPWWHSRAIIGALVVVAAQGLRFTGWEIDTEALTDALISALTLVGRRPGLVGPRPGHPAHQPPRGAGGGE